MELRYQLEPQLEQARQPRGRLGSSGRIYTECRSRGNYATVRSYVGEEMNWIYGKGYKRAPQGATYTDANGNVVDCSGMKLINASDGMPQLDDAADTA